MSMKKQSLPVRRRHNPELVYLHQLKAERCENARQWRRAIHEWSQVIANSGTKEETEHAIQRRNKCSIYCRAPYGTVDPRMDYEACLGDIA